MHLRGPVLFGFWGGGGMCVCVCVLDFGSFCCSQCVPIKFIIAVGQEHIIRAFYKAQNAHEMQIPKTHLFFDLWVSNLNSPCIVLLQILALSRML
jgi:hypothetical protein